MSGVNPKELRRAIRDIPDFPKPGILFRDISPILSKPELFRQVVDALADEAEKSVPNKIVGIDARGFLFGAAVAYKLGLGFIPVRKKGKLPYRTISYSYVLEYGRADMEIHIDAVQPEQKEVLVDDMLATGATSSAAVHLMPQLDATVESA